MEISAPVEEYDFEVKHEEFSEDDKDDEYIAPAAAKVKKKSWKPRVVAKWSDDDIFKLIGCVRRHPGLWDARCGQYRKKRTKLWHLLSEKIFHSKFPGTELLAKWSNMRIQFRSNLNKKTKNRGGTPRPINWKFYSAMQFLEQAECSQTSATESNLISTDDTENSTSSIGLFPTPNISPPTQRSSKRRLASTSSTATSQSSAATLVNENIKTPIRTVPPSKQLECDEFEAFGKFLASELRSLDDIAMARRIKRKVNRCLLDAVDEEQNMRSTQKCKNKL